MATRVISWGSKAEIVSPRLSKTPFMISFDSVNYDHLGTRPAVDGAPHATGSQVKHTRSQGIVPSGSGASSSVSVYPGAGAAEGSFIRHSKYFFNDGNVTFLVGNTLYCVHRYFFSRDSIYFSTRFAMLDIRDYEALPTIISLGDTECKDFDAFLSVLYPEDFEENRFSYEEWKSVLHLSTRWSFASIRKLVLRSIDPPTPHDRLLLARTYSVEEWVVPALSALCGRTKPLTLSEARQMSIEDVVLVSTVREDIRSHTLHVDAAEIPHRVEAEQLSSLGFEVPFHLRFPKSKAFVSVRLKQGTKEEKAHKIHESDSERQAEKGVLGNTNVLKGASQLVKNSLGEAATTCTVETGAAMLTANSIGIQQNDPEEDNIGLATFHYTQPQTSSSPRQPDVAEPTLGQTGDGAAEPAVPGTGPIPSEADHTPATNPPPEAAADPEVRNTPEVPLTAPADYYVPPPIPAKDAAVFNTPIPASQQTSTSSFQATDLIALEAVNRDKAGGAISSSSEEAAKSDKLEPEAIALDPTGHSGADDGHATGEGSTATQGEDAKSEKPPKLTLPMDRLRLFGTSAITAMSSSSVKTPVDEAGLPASDAEGGGVDEPASQGKFKRKKKPKKKRVEKNGPRFASGTALNHVDHSIEQETKPVTSDPVDVRGGEGNGVLVERTNYSAEDLAVFVDVPQAVIEVEKTTDITTIDSDEWDL